MNIISLFVSIAVAAYCVSASADEPMTVTGPALKIEGGQAASISSEEAACALLRQQTMDRTAVCEPRYAQQVGLAPARCAALTKAATAACDEYAQSFVQQPVSFSQCLKASDRHRKCTLVISNGCEYTKVLAQKLESVEGTRDAELIAGAIKSECPRPNVSAMAAKASEGTLRVAATLRQK